MVKKLSESSDECKVALQAAMDLIGEKCGIVSLRTKTLELYGLKVTVPAEVTEVASSNPNLTRAERVEAISKSQWAKGWAGGMIDLVSPGLTGKEREEALERLSVKLAERVV